MSTTVNSTLTQSQQIFHDLVWQPLILAGETWLFAEVPILNTTVISAITREAISEASEYFFGQLVLFIDINAIKFINQEHQTAFDNLSEQLSVVIHDKGINSEEFIKARDAAAIAMRNLTRINQ